MNARGSVAGYLWRDSLLRWRGRLSVPAARLTTAASLATAALLVLASFALGAATLEARIARFGLDALVLRAPLRRASDPAPAYPALGEHGRVLTLKVPYASASLDVGGRAGLAIADDATLAALAALGADAARLPVLLSDTLPPQLPVRASLGPWGVSAVTIPVTPALRPLGLDQLLIVRPSDFPVQAALPGVAWTLFVRDPGALPLERIAAAVETVVAANPTDRAAVPTVQSSLPLLRELGALQATWLRYAALLAGVLAGTIAAVFGSGAILEFEATAYTTALLRSFGVSRATLWLQRYLESALLANVGGAVALALAAGAAHAALPQFSAHLLAGTVTLPVALALNAGALVATLPVALALRRPVGLVLQ